LPEQQRIFRVEGSLFARPSTSIISFIMAAISPNIITPRLRLRVADQRDVPAVVDYYRRNKDYLAPWEPERDPSFFTEELWTREVAANLRALEDDQALWLYLFSAVDGAVIGAVNFTGFMRGPCQYCYLGYSLAEERQGHGYMTEALTASIDYVFHSLNMRRVMADYIPRNERSGRLLRRLGFVVEGYARDYLNIGGQWEDHIRTSLINPDWRP
jgi:[ribosomal protein S5]-alanine N-acetyltransferase